MSRGDSAPPTSSSTGKPSADDLRAALAKRYTGANTFVHVAEKGVLPQTPESLSGTNYVQIGVFADRIKNRASSFRVLDNLVKGSAGRRSRT